MFSFTSWITVVVGASIIITFLEMILPIGKMNDFLKSVLNIFYCYLVLYPIIDYIKFII